MDPTHLKSIPLFAEVPDDELAKIATFAQEVTVEEGRELVREGESERNGVGAVRR